MTKGYIYTLDGTHKADLVPSTPNNNVDSVAIHTSESGVITAVLGDFKEDDKKGIAWVFTNE